MAMEDHYVCVYEDGYTSEEDDIADSVVHGIVEEAFRGDHHESNRNHRSQKPYGRLRSSDDGIVNSLTTDQEFYSNPTLPAIKITEIEDTNSDTMSPAQKCDVDSETENQPRCTVSDGCLPEKTVRFAPQTPCSSPNRETKKYPTTPKHSTSHNLGPSLRPIAPSSMTKGSSPVMNELPKKVCNTKGDDTSPPLKINGYLKDTDDRVFGLEEDMLKLQSAIVRMGGMVTAHMKMQGTKEACEASMTTSDGQSTAWTELERELLEAMSVSQTLNKKWTELKKHLKGFIADARHLEQGFLLFGKRIKEQKDLILKLKEDRRALEEYMQEKGYEWYTVKKCLRSDSNFIKGLAKEAQHYRSKDTEMLWKILDSFLLVHFEREKAIALDTAKQNKINELHLLICRQQRKLAEVEERNRDLERQIQHTCDSIPTATDANISSIKDVLYCDHCWFSPLSSTSPEYASLQMLNIGGPHPELNYEKKPLPDSAGLFCGKEAEKEKEDLSKYDQTLLEELSECGPGNKEFRLE